MIKKDIELMLYKQALLMGDQRIQMCLYIYLDVWVQVSEDIVNLVFEPSR